MGLAQQPFCIHAWKHLLCVRTSSGVNTRSCALRLMVIGLPPVGGLPPMSVARAFCCRKGSNIISSPYLPSRVRWSFDHFDQSSSPHALTQHFSRCLDERGFIEERTLAQVRVVISKSDTLPVSMPFRIATNRRQMAPLDTHKRPVAWCAR